MQNEPPNATGAVARRLRAVMAVTGMTVEMMAQTIVASEAYVTELVAGSRYPKVQRMRRLAKRAGVTLGWIFYGDEVGLAPITAERLRAELANETDQIGRDGGAY